MWGISGDIAQDAHGDVEAQLLEQLKRQAMQEQIRQFNARQEVEQQQIAQRQREHTDEMGLRGRQEDRLTRGVREEDAAATAASIESQFDPGSPLDPEVSPSAASALAGTRQASRINEIPTLSARPTVPGMGEMGPEGVGVRRLAPTGQQQGQRRQVAVQQRQAAEVDRMLADPVTPPKLRTILNLTRVGVDTAPIGPTALETADDRKAEDDRDFQNFQRRENYQDRLVRGRQPVRAPRDAEKDRRDAMRAARRDAIAEFNARKDPMTGQPTVDLDTLIDEYEDEYLGVLEAIEAGDDTGAGPGGASDGGGGLVPVSPVLAGLTPKGAAPKGPRQVSGLTRRAQPSTGAGATIRYDAAGNRVK